MESVGAEYVLFRRHLTVCVLQSSLQKATTLVLPNQVGGALSWKQITSLIVVNIVLCHHNLTSSGKNWYTIANSNSSQKLGPTLYI